MIDEETNKIIARLKQAFEKNNNVLLAYLFGSRARGEQLSLSDYDIAVLLEDNSLSGLADTLWIISKTLKISEEKIDMLDLAKAPLYLKARILKEGIRIIDKGYENSIKLEVNIKYPEISYQNNELLKKWLKNPNGLDLEVIKDRLDYIIQLNNNLKTFLKRHNPEDLLKDFEAWYALKAIIQDLIQAMIDICAHVFSSKNLGIADSYSEYVKKLAEHGYMKKELVEELKIAIAMRNRLIHRYLIVKSSELWSFAIRLIKVIPEFKEWILSIIKTLKN